MKYFIYFCYLWLFYLPCLQAKNIDVAVELFPPAIISDHEGSAIEMLKALEQVSDLRFTFHIMNYARAKKELKNHRVDMIGLTPQGLESASFYQFATDIEWTFPTKLDLFTYKNHPIPNLNITPDHSLGTLRGNADFFSHILHIPKVKFIEFSSLEQLAHMLSLGRIQGIIFDHVAMESTFKKLNINEIQHKEILKIPATFSVNKNKKGLSLKSTIDKLLTDMNTDKFFIKYVN